MGVKKHKDTHPVIRFLLTESRLNRIQISEKLGISLKGLVAWENGSVYIAEYMLDDLSAAAGVSLDRIPLHLKKRGEEIRDARILKRTNTSNGKTASATSAPQSAPRPADGEDTRAVKQEAYLHALNALPDEPDLTKAIKVYGRYVNYEALRPFSGNVSIFDGIYKQTQKELGAPDIDDLI